MDPKRILIIDDEVAFTNLVKLNLEKTGRYAVRVEDNPAAALTSGREFQPDLLLLDVIMPGRDGGQVLAEWHKDPDLGRVPALFMTATMTQRGIDQHQGTIHGMPFLAKPVEPKKLMRRIDELVALNGGQVS